MWSDELSCNVNKLEYDFIAHEGFIDFPDNNCCDMGGCLKFFMNIDPDVRTIQTSAAGKRDTRYKKLTDDMWEVQMFINGVCVGTVESRGWVQHNQSTQHGLDGQRAI